jgi:hypothetical protein
VEKISLPALLTRLYQDAVGVVHAEIRLAKSKALSRVRAARTGLILLGAAAIVALSALGGLVTGLVIALVPLVGGVLAGLIVLAGGLILAGLLGWIGARALSGAGASEDTEKAA